MLTFQRIFQTRQQAMDAYKTQLSGQKLYVESFEGYQKGTEVIVNLEIRETSQKISLKGTVERLVGKKEAVDSGYGQRPGLILNVPITAEIVEPLRAFFLAQAVAKPAVSQQQTIPLEGIDKCDPAEAIRRIKQFITLADSGNLFQLFNVRPNYDRKALRTIYNTVVRKLHPDAHDGGENVELSDLLSDAYQVFNDGYKVLQHPVLSVIYMEVSRANRAPGGMSLNAFKQWQADYRMKNANNIRLGDEFATKAKDAVNRGDREAATQNIKLALQYDPYNEVARSIQL